MNGNIFETYMILLKNLYDLVNDPDENSNLISQETKKSVEMSHLMDELLNQKTQ